MKVQNFRLSIAHVKFYEICTLIGSFCWKYIKFQQKRTDELYLMTLKSNVKFEKKLICCFKYDKNLVKSDPSTQKSQKICTLIGSFYAKYMTLDLKKYRGVIFHDNEEWCKIWWKTDFLFGKWHEEFVKFSPEQLKVSKLGLWWDPFIQSRKCMSLKFNEELCVMTMKNEAKFEEELTCRSKTDIRNLTNFDASTRKSQKFSL